MSEGTLPLNWFGLSVKDKTSSRAGRADPGEEKARLADVIPASAADKAPGPSDALGQVDGLVPRANDVANFLKALGHDGRLMILCHLAHGPKSVTELENLLSARQAVVSQQLARLRLEGLVSARREGQAIFYSILDPKVAEVLAVLARLFCKPA